MDVEAVIAGLEGLDRWGLARVEDALGRRLRDLEAEAPADGRESRIISGVVEYRPHADGALQAEVRCRVREDVELYLGKTEDPEGEPARERTASAGESY